MFDIGGIASAIFGQQFGSFIDSVGGNEKLEKLRESCQTASPGDQMTSSQGTSFGGWMCDLIGSAFESVFGKEEELGITRQVQTNGYAPSPSWNQQYASAVDALRENFEALDTAAGAGGKDGFISRTDLEAALKNPDLSPQLRAACRFLLENPAAWNQLDVSSGIGEVDGLIARCDVDAAAAQVEGDSASSALGDGTVKGHGRHGAGYGRGCADAEEDPIAEDDAGLEDGCSTCSSHDPAGPAEADEGFSGNLWEQMEKYDGEMEQALAKLETAKSPTEVAKYQLELQQAVEKRKLMYELVSTMSRLEHEMAKTALGNMGRA